ncbi:MAG TPA: BON domain-containing protein [Burkholderiales bacterium]|nr:BON domain-containing protein [Burkholderiales bacterium]
MAARIALALAVFLALASAAARADPHDGVERYDSNRDGYVSFDEWRSMGGEPSVFRDSDLNRDGRLSAGELDAARVRDERVKAAETAGDAWISAKVTAALLMDRELTISDMRVTTRDGQVRLSGVVHRDDEAQAAERIAWRVEGVRAVVNSLSVRPSLSARSR